MEKPILKKKSPIQGSQRSLSPVGTSAMDWTKRYDFEIEENVVRTDRQGITREIVEAFEYCYEVHHTCTLAANSAFSSTDGDDQGFTVAPDYNFGTTDKPNLQPIHPTTYQICLDVIRRESWAGEYVIGGDKLQKGLMQLLGLGDTFLELEIDREGIGRNDWCVSRTMYLPTYEVFRKESDQGVLMGYEQRRYLDDKEAIKFDPYRVVHLRHDQHHLYGRSAWKQSIATGKWAAVKDAWKNLGIAARDLAINPTVFEADEALVGQTAQENFKTAHSRDAVNGPMAFLYLPPGIVAKKLGSQNPNLQTLLDVLLAYRSQMMLPGLPVYLFANSADNTARELSAQPALQHCRLRNGWCAMLSKGIYQVLNTEIRLRMGDEFFREHGQYRIIWPTWSATEMLNGVGADETDAAGMDDLDANNEQPTPASKARLRVA